MIGRVSTFFETNYLMSLNMGVQAKLATAETQESSGVTSQTFGGLGGDAGKILNINGQITRLTTDSDNATTSLSTMQETYSTLSSITDLASEALSDLSSAMSGGTVDSSTVSSEASSWLSQLTSLLNTQYEGNYLFSGTASDTAPVDTSASDYDPSADATASSTAYYMGSTTGEAYTGADGYTVSTSVQADAPGFEKMLRALSMIVADPSSTSTLSSAYDLIKTGSSEVAEDQASLSASSSSLTDYQTTTSSKITALTTLSSDLDGADLSQAAVLVTNYQAQLEASYSVVTKLMEDSLAKYL